MAREVQRPEWGERDPEGTQALLRTHLFETEANRKILIGQGKYVLTTAFDHSGRMKLIFQGKDGWKGYWVTREEYERKPRGVAVLTLDDFPTAKQAKNADAYDGEYDIPGVARRARLLSNKKERSKLPRLTK